VALPDGGELHPPPPKQPNRLANAMSCSRAEERSSAPSVHGRLAPPWLALQQHQVQVGVQSAGGAGSTFWFSLKLAPPEPPLEGRTEEIPEGWPEDDGQQA
jgi:hypothetical protein